MVKGIELFDAKGQSQGLLELKIDVPQKESSTRTFACAIRVLLQNWRQGTVACKGRGEVAFSGKKPWKQKGTGRARAGTISSPLWRKGGVIFGPQPRVRKLKMVQKQRGRVFNNILNTIYQQGGIKCLDLAFDADKFVPKSKVAVEALKGMGLNKEKVTIFIDFNDSVAFSIFRNLPNVNLLFFDQPNAYDLSNSKCWVFLKKDMNSFKNMVSKWN